MMLRVKLAARICALPPPLPWQHPAHPTVTSRSPPQLRWPLKQSFLLQMLVVVCMPSSALLEAGEYPCKDRRLLHCSKSSIGL